MDVYCYFGATFQGTRAFFWSFVSLSEVSRNISCILLGTCWWTCTKLGSGSREGPPVNLLRQFAKPSIPEAPYRYCNWFCPSGWKCWLYKYRKTLIFRIFGIKARFNPYFDLHKKCRSFFTSPSRLFFDISDPHVSTKCGIGKSEKSRQQCSNKCQLQFPRLPNNTLVSLSMSRYILVNSQLRDPN